MKKKEPVKLLEWSEETNRGMKRRTTWTIYGIETRRTTASLAGREIEADQDFKNKSQNRRTKKRTISLCPTTQNTATPYNTQPNPRRHSPPENPTPALSPILRTNEWTIAPSRSLAAKETNQTKPDQLNNSKPNHPTNFTSFLSRRRPPRGSAR